VSEDYDIVSPLPGDAEEMGRLHVRIWQEAYAELMPSDYLSRLDPAERARMWRAVLTDEAARHAGGEAEPDDVATRARTRAARHRTTGAIVGIASAGPARDPEPVRPVELWMINVASSHRGTGVAELLVQATLGDAPAYLWILSGNDRAQAFYRRLGFTDDGHTKVHGPTATVERRMVRYRV
jgi:ribosomal protein S18 acetylase RimI-like enzyme